MKHICVNERGQDFKIMSVKRGVFSRGKFMQHLQPLVSDKGPFSKTMLADDFMCIGLY